MRVVDIVMQTGQTAWKTKEQEQTQKPSSKWKNEVHGCKVSFCLRTSRERKQTSNCNIAIQKELLKTSS